MPRLLVKYYFWMCMWKYFWKINIWIGKLNKGDGLLQCEWIQCNDVPKENQRWKKGCLYLSWDPFSPTFRLIGTPSSIGFQPQTTTYIYHQPSPDQRQTVYTSDSDWIMPPAFLVLQIQNMGLTGLHNNMSQFLW